jgi:hypothetical protein
MILPIIILSLSLASGSKEFDRAAAEGAAKIAVSSIKERLLKTDQHSDVLKGAMLKEPAKAVKCADAEVFCRQIYLKTSSDKLKNEVDAVLKRLAGERGVENVFPPELVESVKILTPQEERSIAEGPFKKSFALARKEACLEQAKGLAVKIRPSMIEADNDDDKVLQKKLVERIASSQSKVVFEENYTFISEKMVKPIIEDARKEKKRQAEYVRRVRSDSLSPSALSKDISEKLAANVSERSKKVDNPAMAWGIFPSVTNETLRNNVERRIDRHFENTIAEIQLEITEEILRGEILSDIAAHRKALDSQRIIESAYCAKLLSSSHSAALSAAPEKERDELSAYLKSRMSARNIAKAAKSRIDAGVTPLLSKARLSVVNEQYARLWPELERRTWSPSPELADDICSRADYGEAVKAWRRLPQLVELSKERDSLEEVDIKADEGVAEAFELARSAISAQSAIVEKEMPVVLEEAISRKDSLWRRTPNLNEIISMLTTAAEERWIETKNSTLWPRAGSAPENANDQHRELFPSVKKKIESIARMIFKEMEKEPEKREEPKKPQEQTPQQSEEQIQEELCTITFEMSGRTVKVKAEKGSRVVAERTESATAAGFEKAIREVGAIVGRDVLKLR